MLGVDSAASEPDETGTLALVVAVVAPAASVAVILLLWCLKAVCERNPFDHSEFYVEIGSDGKPLSAKKLRRLERAHAVAASDAGCGCTVHTQHAVLEYLLALVDLQTLAKQIALLLLYGGSLDSLFFAIFGIAAVTVVVDTLPPGLFRAITAVVVKVGELIVYLVYLDVQLPLRATMCTFFAIDIAVTAFAVHVSWQAARARIAAEEAEKDDGDDDDEEDGVGSDDGDGDGDADGGSNAKSASQALITADVQPGSDRMQHSVYDSAAHVYDANANANANTDANAYANANANANAYYTTTTTTTTTITTTTTTNADDSDKNKRRSRRQKRRKQRRLTAGRVIALLCWYMLVGMFDLLLLTRWLVVVSVRLLLFALANVFTFLTLYLAPDSPFRTLVWYTLLQFAMTYVATFSANTSSFKAQKERNLHSRESALPRVYLSLMAVVNVLLTLAYFVITILLAARELRLYGDDLVQYDRAVYKLMVVVFSLLLVGFILGCLFWACWKSCGCCGCCCRPKKDRFIVVSASRDVHPSPSTTTVTTPLLPPA